MLLYVVICYYMLLYDSSCYYMLLYVIICYYMLLSYVLHSAIDVCFFLGSLEKEHLLIQCDCPLKVDHADHSNYIACFVCA